MPESLKKKLRIDGKATMKGEKPVDQAQAETYVWNGVHYLVTEDTPEEWKTGRSARDKKRRSREASQASDIGKTFPNLKRVEESRSQTRTARGEDRTGANEAATREADDDDNDDDASRRPEDRTRDGASVGLPATNNHRSDSAVHVEDAAMATSALLSAPQSLPAVSTTDGDLTERARPRTAPTSTGHAPPPQRASVSSCRSSPGVRGKPFHLHDEPATSGTPSRIMPPPEQFIPSTHRARSSTPRRPHEPSLPPTPPSQMSELPSLESPRQDPGSDDWRAIRDEELQIFTDTLRKLAKINDRCAELNKEIPNIKKLLDEHKAKGRLRKDRETTSHGRPASAARRTTPPPDSQPHGRPTQRTLSAAEPSLALFRPLTAPPPPVHLAEKNRGGQPLRHSATLTNFTLSEQRHNAERAEAAILEGIKRRLDGESRTAKRRRVRRELDVYRGLHERATAQEREEALLRNLPQLLESIPPRRQAVAKAGAKSS
jgi:hypothetical protein